MPRAQSRLEVRSACSLALALAVVLAACSGAQPARDAGVEEAPRIPVTIDAEGGSVIFQAELADSPSERTRGLMYRTEMADGEGMLFLFPAEQQLSFWMRNTLIPLDMIFIRADHTILGVVENAVPRTDTPRAVPGVSQFVLEINGGLAAKHGIASGQTVQFYAPIPGQ